MIKKHELVNTWSSNIVDDYNIGKILSTLNIGNGLHSDVFRIETTFGIFTVKIYKHKQEDELQYEITLLKLLENNASAPRIIQNNNNAFISKTNNKCCIIYHFIDGKQPDQITNKQIIETAGFLGKFHKLIENENIIGKRNDLSLKGLNIILQENKQLILDKALKGKQYLPKIEKYFNQWHFPDTLPHGPIHADIKPDNTLFDENDTLNGVIDFDNSFVGPLLLDICKTIMWWCAFEDNKINKEKLSLWLHEYQKQRTITSEEKKYFYDMLQFAFISHAAWDLYLNADNKKTPDWYIEEVVFKLFKIGEQMQITREEMRELID
ncbi:phosphotransferase [Candidatus Woesearchaeota archaeon]|nr:phosphotransferase [Candidatus Woesearchaeota archaeon]